MDLLNISIYDLQNIFNFCDFKSQLYLSSSCKLFNNNLLIADLYNINNNVSSLLNDKILKQSKYKHITKLNASGNEKIKDVSQMASALKILYAGSNCGIDQNSIKDLYLTELYAGSNCKIDQNSIK